MVLFSGEGDAATTRRAMAAAELFRQRRHISQEDTISMGSFEDVGRSTGRVENPSPVSLHTNIQLTRFNFTRL